MYVTWFSDKIDVQIRLKTSENLETVKLNPTQIFQFLQKKDKGIQSLVHWNFTLFLIC